MSFLAAGLVVDHRAESFVGVSDVDDEDGLAGIIEVTHERVREEGLTASGRTHDESVVVGHASGLLRRVLHVYGDRDASQTVSQLDPSSGDAPLEGLADSRAQAAAKFHGHEVVPGYLACRSRESGVPDDRRVERVANAAHVHPRKRCRHLSADRVHVPLGSPDDDVEMVLDGHERVLVDCREVFLQLLRIELVLSVPGGHADHLPAAGFHLRERLLPGHGQYVRIDDVLALEQGTDGRSRGCVQLGMLRAEPLRLDGLAQIARKVPGLAVSVRPYDLAPVDDPVRMQLRVRIHEGVPSQMTVHADVLHQVLIGQSPGGHHA